MDAVTEIAPSRSGTRLDRLPPGAFHVRVAAIIGAIVFFDFFDLTMAGAVAGALLHDGWSTLRLNAVFLAVTGLGGAAGTLLGGILADRIGRRTALRYALAVVAIATLAGAFAPDMTTLIWLRGIAGIGMGAVPTVAWTLLAEFMPPRVRGQWACYAATFGNCSIVVASLAGYFLLPDGGWRWMFVIPGGACLLLWWIVGSALPESPRWLESKGRYAEADRSLTRIERSSAAPVHRAPDEIEHENRMASDGRFERSLFGRSLLPTLLLATGVAVGSNVAIYGFISWLPTMLLGEGIAMANTMGQNLLIACGSPVGAILGTVAAGRFRRKPAIIAISAVAAALALLFAATAGTTLAVGVGFVLLLTMSLLSTMVLSVYLPELFPTAVRAEGGSIAVATSRVATILLPFAMISLIERHGSAGAMGLVTASLLLVAAAVSIVGKETANQPLDHIRRY